MNDPDKNIKFPLSNYEKLYFIKNVVTNPNIIVGDYTYVELGYRKNHKGHSGPN